MKDWVRDLVGLWNSEHNQRELVRGGYSSVSPMFAKMGCQLSDSDGSYSTLEVQACAYAMDRLHRERPECFVALAGLIRGHAAPSDLAERGAQLVEEWVDAEMGDGMGF